MARTVTATEANQNFSRLLNEAAGGEAVTITQRGQPAALLSKADGLSLREQARAFDEALEHYATLKRVLLRGWTRASLYDRTPWSEPE